MHLLTPFEQQLIALIQQGLPLVSRPYAQLGQQLGVSEDCIIQALAELRDNDIIKRFGVIVRHRKLGYCANGMVVWDVPDAHVDDIGQRLSSASAVTLCYRRPRHLPAWPYNLFTMIHGQSRTEVTDKVSALVAQHQLEHLDHDILFSRRCFKQRGAYYVFPDLNTAQQLDIA